MLRPAVVAAALIALTGCASTITSELPNSAASPQAGAIYYLPTSLTRFALVANDRGIMLQISEPEIVADLSQPLLLRHKPNDVYNDVLKISLQNGLLQTVESETEQQLEGIAKGIGTGLGGFRKLENSPPSETVLFEYFVDITDSEAIKKIKEDLKKQLSENGAARRIATERKIYLKVGANTVGDADVGLQVIPAKGSGNQSAEKDGIKPQSTTKLNLNDCKVGICTRPLVAVTIQTTLFGQTFAQVVRVPDPSATSVIPIPRRALSNVKTKLTLQKGILTDYNIDSKSVVAELVELPADLIGSYLSAANTAFTNRTSLVKAETEALKAKAELEKARDTQQSKTESAVGMVGIPVPGFTLGATVPSAVSPPGAGGSALAPRNGSTDAGAVTPPLDPKPRGKAGQ
jgi:hypothetical protein